MPEHESEDEEVPEHLRDTTFGSRDDPQDPYKERQQEEAEADEDVDPIEEMLANVVEIRDGSETPSIGCRDDLFAAYMEYLRANPERMEDVGEELQAGLDHPPDVDTTDKAGILRLLIRRGLDEAVPEDAELLRETNAEYARRNA